MKEFKKTQKGLGGRDVIREGAPRTEASDPHVMWPSCPGLSSLLSHLTQPALGKSDATKIRLSWQDGIVS
eukprot:182233-Amphidinium_carterae.1